MLAAVLGGGFLAAPAAAAPATTARYIVRLTGSMPKKVTAHHRFGGALRGFSADLTPAKVAELRRDPAVAAVDPVRQVRISDTQTGAPWGLDRVDQRSLPLDSAYTWTGGGAGVTAYVVDTGVMPTHSDFGDRASAPVSTVDDPFGVTDCHGHGTHVAGTLAGSAYGVAKRATIIGVRVLDCQGSGTDEEVIAGLDWVIAHHTSGPAVVNMSLGGDPSPALEQAVEATIADGIVVVAAAGNDSGDACGHSPARVPAAVTVGATSDDDSLAWFSNRGPCVDLLAPGDGVLSAATWSSTATTTMSGTSMAAPHVAGAAALMLGREPQLTPAVVAARLSSSATPDKITGVPGSTPNLLLSTLTTPLPLATAATRRLPDALTGRPYRATLRATGGVGPYTWSVTGGALPAGLTLSAAGTVSGTPASTTTANPSTVRLRDAAGTLTSSVVTVAVRAPGLPALNESIPVVRSSGGGQLSSDAGSPSLSADGRYVAFVTAGDVNPADVYVTDLVTATTTLVSRTTAGTAGDGASWEPDISADGRWIAFTSEARLTGEDTNDSSDVYLADRTTGTVRLISRPAGGPAAGGSHSPSVSSGGTAVAYVASEPELWGGTGYGITEQVIVANGPNTLVSVTTSGAAADVVSDSPVISDDGRYVGFTSLAGGLTANGQSSYTSHAYRRDLVARTTVMVSAWANGDADAWGEMLDLSADGRYALFTSMDDLTGSGSFFTQAYRRDLTTGATVVASRDPGATATSDQIISGTLSRDGSRAIVGVHRSDAFDPAGDRSSLLSVTLPTGVSVRVADWYPAVSDDFLTTRYAWDGAALSLDGTYATVATTDATAIPGYLAGPLTPRATRLR
ncbi:S8 family serine peptidase [Actinoplanes subglobosus]|uniref:S8 family serine peptidase n=1 Tax=Actinoplanes subglobosus TaxID=1547892 RepID=A0ABV8IQP6_9ACTN